MVILANQIINMPNKTHCGESMSRGAVSSESSSSSSGNTGESLSTVVSMLTVDTVTSSRNAVSTREHLLTGWHLKMLIPSGINMAARAQSTSAWWNSRPCDHLKHKTGRVKSSVYRETKIHLLSDGLLQNSRTTARPFSSAVCSLNRRCVVYIYRGVPFWQWYVVFCARCSGASEARARA